MGDWCGKQITATPLKEITGAVLGRENRSVNKSMSNLCQEIRFSGNGGLFSLTEGLLMGDPSIIGQNCFNI
jgi:hypothetical protein